MNEIFQRWNGSFKKHWIGFFLSLILLSLAYMLVAWKVLDEKALMMTIVGLAFLQAIVQLVFFLHLASESGPRWNLWFFLFMVLILAVIFGGSLWIMYNLNYNMMPATMPKHMGGF